MHNVIPEILDSIQEIGKRIIHGPGKVDIRARVMAIGLVRGGVSCVVLDERFDMRARFPKIGGATHPSLRKVPCPRCYLP